MNNEPVALKFPTMLRKMWSGGEVQAWLDKLPPLYAHPAKTLTDTETALRSLYEAVIRYENLSLFPDKYAIESCEYQLHDAKEKARAILRKAQEK